MGSQDAQTKQLILDLLACMDENDGLTTAEVSKLVNLVIKRERAARINEYHQMIGMIKSTDMDTQLREYWRAGNIRLAQLQRAQEESTP